MLTVAATRPESVLNSVSNVTVISREAIERYGFDSIAEALQTVAGVSVARTYLMKRIPTIRGIQQEHYADKVLVMIDGVPAWNAVTGEGDIDRVGIDAVERIEILRGPASVRYGTNALTGAINIVLRRPKASEGSLRVVSGGLASTHGGGHLGAASVSKASGLYSSAKEDSSTLFAASLYGEGSEPYSFQDESGTSVKVRDYFNARNATIASRRGGHTLLLNAYDSNQNYGGNALTLDSGERRDMEKEAQLFHYSYQAPDEWSSLNYSMTYDRQRRGIPRDASDGLRSDIQGWRLVNSLGGAVDLPRSFVLEFGGEHEYLSSEHYDNFITTSLAVAADNSLRGRSAWEGSLFLQLGFDLGGWKGVLGSRFTHSQGTGDDLSSRGSLVYMLGEDQSVKFVAGQSFRVPTLFERYFQTSPVTVVGNPDLRPEKSRSVELSYGASWGNAFTQATVYYAGYSDSIIRTFGDFTRDGVAMGAVNHYANAGRYDAKGLELEARYTAAKTSVFASFDGLLGGKGDAQNIAAPGVNGLPGAQSWNFKYVPRYTLSAGGSQSVATPLGELSASALLMHQASVDTMRTRLPPQAWGDVSVGLRRGPVRHLFAVKNVTGARIETPEYARQRVVESLPLFSGRRFEYTFTCRF